VKHGEHHIKIPFLIVLVSALAVCKITCRWCEMNVQTERGMKTNLQNRGINLNRIKWRDKHKSFRGSGLASSESTPSTLSRCDVDDDDTQLSGEYRLKMSSITN
jgi:hypothetical protein